MKKLRKISGALLLGAITIGVTACGAKSEVSTSNSEATNSTVAQESSSAANKPESSANASSTTTSSSVGTSAASSSKASSSTAASSSKASSSAAASSSKASSSAAASSSKASSSAASSSSPIGNVDKDEKGITIVEQVAYTEGAYVTFNCDTTDTPTDYEVSYTIDGTNYTTVDNELVRLSGTTGRVDIVGLKAGTYLVKIAKGNNNATTGSLVVTADDRSGYAHFNNTTGVGAYNNDGTLKSDAIVVYVTNATKNTVTATIEGTEYTGISKIIQASQYSSKPIAIRILDEIQAQQWTTKTHGTGSTEARMTNLDNTFADVDWEATSESQMSSSNYYKIGEEDIIKYGINTLSDTGVKYDADGNATTVTGITHLDGLTNVINKCKNVQKSGYYEYDSYYNELDVRYGNNITVEGIGDSAGIFQWGFCFNQCNSIEVKNLEFSSYNEDAIGIQGGSSTNMDYHNFWIHNCTFNTGVNNWDVCFENDKTDGDGSTDFKYAYGLTISYCRYNKTHKTALIGSGSTSYQYNVTFHHNYYYKCGSRLPFTRNTNFHIYNCYYYGSTGTNMQVQSTAYAFIEGCYFENTNKTFTTSDGGVIKLYNNAINSTSSVAESSTVVYATSRAQIVTNTCTDKSENLSSSGTSYATFDTDPTLFYYDSENNISDVSLMLKAEDTKTYIPLYAGAGKLVQLDYSLNYTETNEGPAEDTSTKATYTETIPTTSGLYGRVTTTTTVETANSDYSNTNYVQNYEDGSFYVYDAGDTTTTYAYYMFENTYTSGKVTYTVTLKTGDNVGSKWNIVQFMTANGNIAVRSGGTVADYKGKICYQLPDGTETLISSTAWAKATTYTIILTVDYDNNVVTLSVNGTEVTLTGYTPEAITGIQFMTAKSATDRSFTVNSIVCKVD